MILNKNDNWKCPNCGYDIMPIVRQQGVGVLCRCCTQLRVTLNTSENGFCYEYWCPKEKVDSNES